MAWLIKMPIRFEIRLLKRGEACPVPYAKWGIVPVFEPDSNELGEVSP